MIANPFILRGYVSDEYFCDRDKETADLMTEIKNGNNVTLIAPRRIGKTGLVQRMFAQEEIKQKYYTFLVDIYATKTLADFIQELGRSILQSLKPKGTKVVEYFLNCLHSLRSSISFDMNGNPSWGVDLGDITSPATSLEEIFHYLETADKPCIVAIDEFQTVGTYREGNVEAILRTYIQHCHNANFIFAGSQRNMMSEMFLSHSRPFYMSTAIKTLQPIDKEVYADFASCLFGERRIKREVIYQIYDRFDGITWYLQRMMNKIYSLTLPGQKQTSKQCNKPSTLSSTRVPLPTKPSSSRCQPSRRSFSLPSAMPGRREASCRRHSSSDTTSPPPVLCKAASRACWRKTS